MADEIPIPPDPEGPWLTIDEAREILHENDPARESEINLFLLQATAIVLDYVKARGDATWTPDTAPQIIKAAVGRALAFTYSGDRGDGQKAEKFWRDLELLLARRRDPALA